MKTPRRDVLKKLSITGFFSSLGLPFSTKAHPKEPIMPVTGADDRIYWANLLYKIAYPVVHHLAEGTLKQQMPLETPPNYGLKVEKVTYMEAIGRTLAGVAPWLALPLVDMLKVTSEHQFSKKEDYEEAVKRMVRYSEFLERLISPEGTFPVFGRSMTYRTAAFQALAQTALMEQLPEPVSPAQVRCGLTKIMQI